MNKTLVVVSADLYKSHIDQYVRKNGSIVQAHDDKRVAAGKKLGLLSRMLGNKDKSSAPAKPTRQSDADVISVASAAMDDKNLAPRVEKWGEAHGLSRLEASRAYAEALISGKVKLHPDNPINKLLDAINGKDGAVAGEHDDKQTVAGQNHGKMVFSHKSGVNGKVHHLSISHGKDGYNISLESADGSNATPQHIFGEPGGSLDAANSHYDRNMRNAGRAYRDSGGDPVKALEGIKAAIPGAWSLKSHEKPSDQKPGFFNRIKSIYS